MGFRTRATPACQRGGTVKTLLAAMVLLLSGAAAPAAQDAASYVVVLSEGASAPTVDGKIGRTFTSALRGFEVTMTPASARRLAAHPAISYVVPNDVLMFDLGVLGTQPNPPSWGLDRIDQRNLPLNNSYTYPNLASNVHAYVMTTGVRVTHSDFGGRARHGWDSVDNDGDASDCHGHGTFVAGLVGGAQHGVAKGVNIVAMRVVNCTGSASIAQIIAGIDWVTANAVRPAVAVLPLGGGANIALDTAVRNSIASGISYTLATGSNDSCLYSPGRVPEGITVDASTITDAVALSSGYGACIDLFGPGQNIVSTWYSSDTATQTLSGGTATSGYTAGAAALVFSANPAWTAKQVHDKVVSDATPGVLTGVPTGAPNRLLYVDNPVCGGSNGTDLPIPDYPGAAVSSTITISGCPGNASAASRIEVHIIHPYIGDLTVDIIAPDGSSYRVHHRTGGSADNIHQTYTVNLSTEPRNGTWRLRLQDHARLDAGHLDSWTVTL